MGPRKTTYDGGDGCADPRECVDGLGSGCSDRGRGGLHGPRRLHRAACLCHHPLLHQGLVRGPALRSRSGRSAGKQSTGLFSDPPHPFGGVHVTTGAPIDARFPGQWFQAESGLHQNWMRNYDPTTGRYLQADPLGLVDGASVYGYARQSPAMVSDPRGEQTTPWFGPRLGPLGIPRVGPRLGPWELPPLVMPRTEDSGKFISHPKAVEQHRKYKRFCSMPPPETGNICTNLLNRAEFLFRCAKMREDWDNEWMPGRHRDAIIDLRRGAQNALTQLGKICASCGSEELNYTPILTSWQ